MEKTTKKFDKSYKSRTSSDSKFSKYKKSSSPRSKSFGGAKKLYNASKKTSNSKFANNNAKNKERNKYNKNEKNVFADTKAILDTRIEIALQTLIDIEKNGKYINLAFKHNDKLDRLEKKDRAYVMRILYGVTEKSYTLDWLLQKVLKEKRVKPWLNAILKIGTYQIFFMKIEDKDAIKQAEELCRKYVADELCGFVTAVLSKLSEHKDEYNPELYKFKNTAERLSVIYSYPEWLVDMWIKDYGIDTTNAIINDETQRTINLRITAKASKEDVLNSLDEAGIKYSDGVLYNTISINDTVNIETLDCYRSGLVTAQGIGSMLTVEMLDVKENSTVLDTCAAPGGKTFYIAEKTKAHVESCDIHEHRVELIKKGIERLGLENVNTVCTDMSIPIDEYKNAFDRVLIDAPCSGLGMIHSKPDIKNNISPDNIKDLSQIQAQLLEVCSTYVKPGGMLIYSTCTVSKQENELNVKHFLESHSDFEIINTDDKIPDTLNYIVDDGSILILPSKYNSDAFFITAMRLNK